MRVRALVPFLIAMALQDIGFAQNPLPTYSLTISAVNSTVKAGSELRVRIVQKNITADDQMFQIESIAALHGEYLYLIDLVQSNGKKATRSKYFREVRDDTDHIMQARLAMARSSGRNRVKLSSPQSTLTSFTN